MVSIVEYFDPRSKNHLIAFIHMEKFGVWPEWWTKTISMKGLTFNPSWKQDLESKMAHEWMKSRLLTSEYENTLNGCYRYHK